MAHVILAKRSSLTIISLQLLIVPKPFLRPVKLTFEPRLNWHGKKVVNVLLLSTKGSNHVQPIVLWSLPLIPHILYHILRSLTTAARNAMSFRLVWAITPVTDDYTSFLGCLQGDIGFYGNLGVSISNMKMMMIGTWWGESKRKSLFISFIFIDIEALISNKKKKLTKQRIIYEIKIKCQKKVFVTVDKLRDVIVKNISDRKIYIIYTENNRQGKGFAKNEILISENASSL